MNKHLLFSFCQILDFLVCLLCFGFVFRFFLSPILSVLISNDLYVASLELKCPKAIT